MASLIFAAGALTYDKVKTTRAKRRARKESNQARFSELEKDNAERMSRFQQPQSQPHHQQQPQKDHLTGTTPFSSDKANPFRDSVDQPQHHQYQQQQQREREVVNNNGNPFRSSEDVYHPPTTTTISSPPPPTSTSALRRASTSSSSDADDDDEEAKAKASRTRNPNSYPSSPSALSAPSAPPPGYESLGYSNGNGDGDGGEVNKVNGNGNRKGGGLRGKIFGGK
ncbi:hypothetical protein MMC24_006003 [Lignoscripta atroalba]|nr:hypothetical protein [Lignoscripta atroalba]